MTQRGHRRDVSVRSTPANADHRSSTVTVDDSGGTPRHAKIRQVDYRTGGSRSGIDVHDVATMRRRGGIGEFRGAQRLGFDQLLSVNRGVPALGGRRRLPPVAGDVLRVGAAVGRPGRGERHHRAVPHPSPSTTSSTGARLAAPGSVGRRGRSGRGSATACTGWIGRPGDEGFHPISRPPRRRMRWPVSSSSCSRRTTSSAFPPRASRTSPTSGS